MPFAAYSFREGHIVLARGGLLMSVKPLRRALDALPALILVCGFVLLSLLSGPASEAARRGLALCAQGIVPALFPFFVLSNLLSALGLAQALARPAAPVMRKLFRLSGAGAAAFLIGVTGGYPLGAATVAAQYRRGELDEAEAKRLVRFCNNSGPAFIVGAAGSAAFGSARAGFLLYAAHVLAALLLGFLLSRRSPPPAAREVVPAPDASPADAFPEAVFSAVKSTLLLCGYVVFFSVAVGLLDTLGVFAGAAGTLSRLSGLGLGQSRALLTGLLELGGGIGALRGQSPDAVSLALAAFLLGWGGLSVLLQTRAVLADTPLVDAPLGRCKLLHGLLSALLAWGLWQLL